MYEENFIFMTNTMKSGSSYLSRILNSHPKISMSYDSLNFFRFSYHKYDPITAPGNFNKLI